MRGARRPRGARASPPPRLLALLLAVAYVAIVVGDASADVSARAASLSATWVVGHHQHQPERRPIIEQQPAEGGPIGRFLRLVEQSATRPTQWHVHGGDGSPTTWWLAKKKKGKKAPPPPPPPPTPSKPPPPPRPEHPPLLPLDWSDYAIFLLAAATLFMAAGGGIGGGTLFVPLLTVVGGFAPTNAVALSNVTVLGGAVANFALNVRRPYVRALRALPRAALAGLKRPPALVDMDLILMMEPATLVGALAGGYVHRLLPSWLLLTLLTALLTFLTWQLAHKGAATYAAESRDKASERAAVAAAAAAAADGGGDSSAPLLGGRGDAEEGVGGTTREQEDPLARLLRLPAPVPVLKLAAVALLTLWMLATDTAKVRLPCGSLPYVLASLSIVPLAAVFTLVQRSLVLRRAAAAAEAAAEAADDDEAHRVDGGSISNGSSDNARQLSPAAVEAALGSHVRWTPSNSLLFPLLSTAAGVCASMFGIGGGVVKGPLMLSLGVCPEVAAATSSTMILFTSAGASLFFYNAGFLQRDYATALLAVAFCVTAGGQVASQWLVHALGRRSVIVFLMAAMMVVAAVVAGVQSAFAVRAAVRDHDLWEWGSICSLGGED
jgi:uncharacterized membrane protein YfcA